MWGQRPGQLQRTLDNGGEARSFAPVCRVWVAEILSSIHEIRTRFSGTSQIKVAEWVYGLISTTR